MVGTEDAAERETAVSGDLPHLGNELGQTRVGDGFSMVATKHARDRDPRHGVNEHVEDGPVACLPWVPHCGEELREFVREVREVLIVERVEAPGHAGGEATESFVEGALHASNLRTRLLHGIPRVQR